MAASAAASNGTSANERPLKLQVVRYPSRQKHIFAALAGSTSLSAFQALVAGVFHVEPAVQSLAVAGVPPRSIDCTDGSATLAALGIRPGDSIELRDAAAEAAAAAEGGEEMKQGSGWDLISLVPRGSGTFRRREMPADNSCLFHAVAFLCGPSGGTTPSAASAHAMRELAANLVASDPQTYTTSFLGSPNHLYQEHLLSPNTWGGAIELSLFARQFQTEILAFDLLHLREDEFGAWQGFKKRCFVIYTGEHYDALVFAGGAGMGGTEQRVFSSADEHAWSRARDAIESIHAGLANEGKCTRQKEWRHHKDLRRGANPASLAADRERERRVQQERSKIATTVVDDAAVAAAAASAAAASSSLAAPPASSSSAGAAAGAISPVSPDDWVCSLCTCANKPSARRCAACDTPNPKAPAVAVAAPPAVSSASGAATAGGPFNCVACTAYNERPSARCIVCNSRQPGAAGDSSANPIDLDDDGVRAPLPQREYQLIGGGGADDEPDLPASAMGLSAEQREAMAQPWQCPRCTMHNEPNSITCSACRSSHPNPLLQPGAMFGANSAAAARMQAYQQQPQQPQQPMSATQRMRAMFRSPPPWVCERCGKSQSPQVLFCCNCRNQNVALQDKILGVGPAAQPECSLM